MYYIGASREEVYRVMKLAGKRNQLASVHARYFSEIPPDSIEGMQEILSNALATGVKIHLAHVHSIFGVQAPVIFEMLEGASKRGLDVSTESLMYTRAGVRLGMVLFDDPNWENRYGFTYSDMMLASNGETLTEESFNKYLVQTRNGEISGWMYVQNYYPEWVHKLSVTHPMSVIASDSGRPGEHPRTAGTFGKLLGEYVRQRQWLSLMEALQKITLQPAQRLETFAPAFRRKGRLQEGMDADITIFDSDRVINRATYTDQLATTEGIEFVLVNGVVVVDHSRFVEHRYPGKALRTTVEVEDSQTRNNEHRMNENSMRSY
jgi:dihydroorotase